jgi:hypothetical protein
VRTITGGLRANGWAHDIHMILGIKEIVQYLMLWQSIQHTILNLETDKFIWKWTTDGKYTAKSYYLVTFKGSSSRRGWKLISRSWAPPRVKFFHWLANQDGGSSRSRRAPTPSSVPARWTSTWKDAAPNPVFPFHQGNLVGNIQYCLGSGWHAPHHHRKHLSWNGCSRRVRTHLLVLMQQKLLSFQQNETQRSSPAESRRTPCFGNK